MNNNADLIKYRVNMFDVMQKFGFQHKRCGCPLHGGKDRNFEFKEKSFVCYSHCGKGDVIEFVKKYCGLSFVEALHWFDDNFALGIYTKNTKKNKISNKFISEHLEKLKKEKMRKINAIREEINKLYGYLDVFRMCEKILRNKYLCDVENPIFSDDWCFFVRKLELINYKLDYLENQLSLIERGDI